MTDCSLRVDVDADNETKVVCLEYHLVVAEAGALSHALSHLVADDAATRRRTIEYYTFELDLILTIDRSYNLSFLFLYPTTLQDLSRPFILLLLFSFGKRMLVIIVKASDR